MRRAAVLVVVGLVAVGLAACDSSSPGPAATTQATPAPTNDASTEAPPTLVVGSEELDRELTAILDEAEVAGGMSYAGVLKSGQLFTECVADDGLLVSLSTVDYAGAPRMEFRIEFPLSAQFGSPELDALSALSDACTVRYVDPVGQIYASQSSTIELQDAHFDKYLDSTLACFVEYGKAIEDDPTQNEVFVANFELEEEQGIDCLAKSGYWEG